MGITGSSAACPIMAKNKTNPTAERHRIFMGGQFLPAGRRPTQVRGSAVRFLTWRKASLPNQRNKGSKNRFANPRSKGLNQPGRTVTERETFDLESTTVYWLR